MMRVILLLVFFLYPFNVLAEMSVYTIEGQIRAAFPAQPKFIGEAGKGNSRSRSYQIADEINVLFYAVTWQVGKTRFKTKDVPEAIRNYAIGNALGVGGKVVSIQLVQIDGNNGSHSIIDYRITNVPVRKYSATIYSDGQFYSWSVQEFPGVSRISGADVFRSYVQYFSLK